MKNILLLLLICAPLFVTAQSGITWTSAIDIAPAMYNNNHPRIAMDANGNPLILWGDDMNNKAYFSRWNGTAFSMPVALNPSSIPVFAQSWAGPDLASHGDTVYAIYKQTPEDTNHIFMVHSYDGGINFSQPVQVDSIGSDASRFPNLGVDASGNPLVAFMRFDAGFTHPQYVVVRSNDFGNTFSTDVLASGFSGGEVCDCCPATIVSSPGYVTTVYRDNLNNIRNMWAGISSDGGITFSNGIQVDQSNWFNNSCPSSGPDGVIVGDSLYAVYMSEGTGAALTYLSSSSVSTLQAGIDMALTGNLTGLTDQNYPRIAHHDNAVAIAWRQTINGSNQVNLFFTSNIYNGLPANYDTIALNGQLINTDLAIAPGIVHTIWENGTSGTIKYRKGTYAITSVEDKINNNAIHVYPNPAHDFVTVNFDTGITDGILNLKDITGRVISNRELSSGTKIVLNLSAVQNGIYILEIVTIGRAYYSRIVVD